VTGGAVATGGARASGGESVTGGAVATGGSRPAGGASSTGGSPGIGGTSTTGGALATGGTRASTTGGAVATGGSRVTGGAPSVGGTAASGGSRVTGGTAGTGGATATGGSSAGANVTAISTGYAHSCALANGKAYCWGLNNYGQVGNNSTASTCPRPAQVQGLTSTVTALSAGFEHTCVLVNGGIQCWGINSYGELGDGTVTNRSVPVQVLGLTAGVTQVVAGQEATCAVADGGVWCWGDNTYGLQGNRVATQSSVPVQVPALPAGSGVTALVMGSRHACVLKAGSAYCWGDNYYGQLGVSVTLTGYDPVAVEGLTGTVTSIHAHYNDTCAIVNGAGYCWGDNTNGQLGNGTSGLDTKSAVPYQSVGLGSGVTAMATGGYHNCAVVGSGVKCWGSNYFSELGNDPTTINESFSPIAVQGLSEAPSAIDAGYHHNCALISGKVYCWGTDVDYELGNGSTTNNAQPVWVAIP